MSVITRVASISHQLLICSLIVVLLTATSASSAAQQVMQLEQLQVDLWPEYDRPRMLIIYRGTLPADAPLPATLTLRLPARVIAPFAVAYEDADGTLRETDHSTTESGDWLLVTLEIPEPNFQLEFYDDLARSGERRSYTFVWPGDYAVEQLTLTLLPPPGATEIQTTPTLSPAAQETQRPVYGGGLGPLEAEQEVRVELSYVGGPTDFGSGTPLPTDDESDNRTLLIVAGGLLASLLVIVTGIWYTRRPTALRRARKKVRRRAQDKKGLSRATTQPPKTAPAAFCTQCGQPLRREDRFCSQCGSPAPKT